jgi:ABC-2 type transport system ATP-binding protein
VTIAHAVAAPELAAARAVADEAAIVDVVVTDAIHVSDLVVRYGDFRAVDGVSFIVRPGEVFGLLGPNGAGKTTAIRALTGLLKPVSGSARVCGLEVARDTMRVRQLIGYVPQQLSVDSALTGWENVWLFARLFDVPRRERSERIEDALGVVGLLDVARRLAATYSGGMIRRLELAQALVNRPRVLILDEPTIGLDPLARAGVWERVEGLRHEFGMSVLLTTHYMDEADALCHRLSVMHRGTIRAEGTPAELKAVVGDGATLDDVFRHFAQDQGGLTSDTGHETFSSVRRTRRTAGRVG